MRRAAQIIADGCRGTIQDGGQHGDGQKLFHRAPFCNFIIKIDNSSKLIIMDLYNVKRLRF